MLAQIGIALGVLFVASTCYFIIIYLQLRWKLRKFRGPLAFPLIGNCYDPAALVFLKHLGFLRKKFGKVFTFFNFTQGFLVICDPVVVRRVLSDTKTFFKGPDYTGKFSIIFGEGLVTSNGEKHKKDRSLFGKFFIRSNINKFAGRVNDIAVKAIDEFCLNADGSIKEKEFNIEHFFATIALRTFMQFSISTDLSNQPEKEKKLCHIVSQASNALGRIIAFSLPLWDIFPEVQIAKKFNNFFRELFHEVVEDRKKKIANGEEIDDCLAVLMKENFAEKDMMDHFATLVSAGHDTTAFFLSYLVYLLSIHQDEQDKLYDILMKELGDRETFAGEDVAGIKYLTYVMMETLRLYAIIPGLTRVSSEEVTIKEAGVTIPKGATVLIPMVIMNRDPEIWDKPSEFRPSRFEERGNDFTSAKDGYFPFGYGSRTCIGNIFAQVESCIVLCHMMKRFRILPAVGYKPNIRSGISLTTSNGIKVVLEKRN